MDPNELYNEISDYIDRVNQNSEEIELESDYVGEIRQIIEKLNHDPTDNSSIFVTAIDRSNENVPTYFYSTDDADAEELQHLVKIMMKELPTPVLVDLMHEVFHEMNITDEDLHETIMWVTKQANKEMGNVNPAIMDMFSSDNRMN